MIIHPLFHTSSILHCLLLDCHCCFHITCHNNNNCPRCERIKERLDDVYTHEMDGWMDGWMAGWMDGWMDGRTNRWMDGRTDGQMDE